MISVKAKKPTMMWRWPDIFVFQLSTIYFNPSTVAVIMTCVYHGSQAILRHIHPSMSL